MKLPAVVVAAFSQFASSFINLGFGVAAAWLLSPTDLGIFSLVLLVMFTVQGLIDSVSTLPATSYRASSPKARDRYVSATLWCVIFSIAASIVVFLISYPAWDHTLSALAIFIVALIILSESARKISMLFVGAKNIVGTDALRLTIFAAVFLFALEVRTGVLDIHPSALILLGVVLLVQLASIYNLRRYAVWPGRKVVLATAYRHLHLAKWYALGTIMYIGFDAPASFLAAKYFGLEAAGYLRIGLIAYGPFNAIVITLETWYARLATNRDVRAGWQLDQKAIKFIVLVNAATFLVVLAGIVLAPYAVPFFFGDHFAGAVPAVWAYLLVSGLNVPRALMLSILRARRNARQVFMIMVWGGISGCIFPALLSIPFGFNGICAGIVVATLVAFIVSVYFMYLDRDHVREVFLGRRAVPA